MSKKTLRYVTIPMEPEFPLFDAVTGKKLLKEERIGSTPQGPITQVKVPHEQMTGTFADVIRGTIADERFKEMVQDGYERNGLRMALTRAKPGEVVEVEPDHWDALCKFLRLSKLNEHWIASGALEIARCVLDAPTTDPREKANGASVTEAQA